MKRIAEYADTYLELLRKVKQVHEKMLAKEYGDAYLVACDVTELAQDLEDITQRNANIH